MNFMITRQVRCNPDTLGYISMLLSKLKEYDIVTYQHSLRVAENAYTLGTLLNLPEEFLRDLKLGASLHDIGKLMIPLNILDKSQGLTEKDRLIINKHPEFGYKILNDVQKETNSIISPVVLNSVRYHHEKINGTGYPFGLKNSQIPFEAKIIAVCDIYDALVFDRPYQKAIPFVKAEKIITEMAKQNDLDGKITKIFLKNYSDSMRNHINVISSIEDRRMDETEKEREICL